MCLELNSSSKAHLYRQTQCTDSNTENNRNGNSEFRSYQSVT